MTDTPAVLTVPEVAERLGCSSWAIYQSLKRDDFAIPPIRIGRKIVFARARVDALLGVAS